MQVGLMDIDICGPSAPRMLGLMGRDIHRTAAGKPFVRFVLFLFVLCFFVVVICFVSSSSLHYVELHRYFSVCVFFILPFWLTFVSWFLSFWFWVFLMMVFKVGNLFTCRQIWE